MDKNNIIDDFSKTLAELMEQDMINLSNTTMSTNSAYTQESNLTANKLIKLMDGLPKSNPIIFHTVPDVISKKLSWKERFMSWPWKPWVKNKFIDNLLAPKKGESFIIQNPASLNFGYQKSEISEKIVIIRESDFNKLIILNKS